MRQLASLCIAAATLAVLLLLFTAPVFTVAAAQSDGAAEGQQIFLAQKCNLCHSVSTAGIEATTKSDAMKGPDLVDLERDAATLESYLTQKSDLDGKKHKKAVKASDPELDALVSWLLAQQK